MKVSVEVIPTVPRAGQEVVFRVTLEDPDAPVHSSNQYFLWVEGPRERRPTQLGDRMGTPGQRNVFGFGVIGMSSECSAYGIWKPPQIVAGRGEFEVRIIPTDERVFDEPGDYRVDFKVFSGGGYYPFCGYPNPYSDIVIATVRFTVF